MSSDAIAPASAEFAAASVNAVVKLVFYRLDVVQIVFNDADQVTQTLLLVLQMLKTKHTLQLKTNRNRAGLFSVVQNKEFIRLGEISRNSRYGAVGVKHTFISWTRLKTPRGLIRGNLTHDLGVIFSCSVTHIISCCLMMDYKRTTRLFMTQTTAAH